MLSFSTLPNIALSYIALWLRMVSRGSHKKRPSRAPSDETASVDEGDVVVNDCEPEEVRVYVKRQGDRDGA